MRITFYRQTRKRINLFHGSREAIKINMKEAQILNIVFCALLVNDRGVVPSWRNHVSINLLSKMFSTFFDTIFHCYEMLTMAFRLCHRKLRWLQSGENLSFLKVMVHLIDIQLFVRVNLNRNVAVLEDFFAWRWDYSQFA